MMRNANVMSFFCACAYTLEVGFVENNDDEEERTIFLDSGLPQEAHVITPRIFSIRTHV